MLAHHNQLLYFAIITNNDSYARFYGSPEGKKSWHSSNENENSKKPSNQPLGLLFTELYIEYSSLQGLISPVISAGRTELQIKSGTAIRFWIACVRTSQLVTSNKSSGAIERNMQSGFPFLKRHLSSHLLQL